MPLPPFPHDKVRAALPDGTVTYAAGSGADVDEAFDAAVADPATPATFAAADPAGITVVADGLTLDQAVGAALGWLEANPDVAGPVAAFGIVGRSHHTRATRRVKVEGATLEPDTSAAGRWKAPAGPLADAIVAAGGGPTGEEMFEFVEYTRRARYKPVVEVIRTKSAGQFVAVAGDQIVSRGHRTGGDARRAGVAALKALPKDEHDQRTLEVYKLGGREDGQPLIRIVRTRVAQVVSVKTVYATAKPGKPAKTVGWLFVTRP